MIDISDGKKCHAAQLLIAKRQKIKRKFVALGTEAPDGDLAINTNTAYEFYHTYVWPVLCDGLDAVNCFNCFN